MAKRHAIVFENHARERIGWVDSHARDDVERWYEATHVLRLKNGTELWFMNQERPERFCGMYFDGVLIDGTLKEQFLLEVLLPSVIDRGGVTWID